VYNFVRSVLCGVAWGFLVVEWGGGVGVRLGDRGGDCVGVGGLGGFLDFYFIFLYVCSLCCVFFLPVCCFDLGFDCVVVVYLWEYFFFFLLLFLLDLSLVWGIIFFDYLWLL